MPTLAPIAMLSSSNKTEKNEESEKTDDDSTLGNEFKKEKVTSEPETLTDSEPKPEKEKTEEENISYQELISKRKQQHMSFLQILDIKSMNDEVASFLPPTLTPSAKRPRLSFPKRRLSSKTEQGPSRKSLRLQNKPASETTVDYSSFTQPEPTPKRKKIRGVVSFAVASREIGDQMPETFVKDLQFLKDETPVTNLQPEALTNYVEKFQKMKIQDSLVAKLAYSRIYCVAVHPSPEKIIFATGSRDGEVSLWDVESRQERLPFLFIPHSERVSCVNFSPYNLSELYTSSYDGSMRCGNLVEGVFNEVFNANADDDDSNILCTSFDFLSSSTFLVSLWHGSVTLVDKRTKNIQGEKDFKLMDCVAKTVSIHPTNKDYFVVAGGNGIAGVWDLRSSVKKPVNELSHQRSLNSAYFSPITGNYVLTTGMDDRLSIFENSTSKAKVTLHKAIRHNNHTGRWLAPLRAVWLPNCEEGFLVGSMEQPRRIEVFGVDGKMAHIFSGDSLGSVCSVNAVHPLRPALAGANSSGKLHVFLGAESK